MKAIKPYFFSGSLVSYAVAFLIIFSLHACARKVTFQNSPVVPAAVGSVKIKKDQNNNYALDINVRNLADPKRLDPPRDVYVVWIDTDRDGAKNIGQMKSSTGLFSGKMKASLSTVTSFRPTRVFITAEDDSKVEYPGMNVVLRTGTFN